MYKTPLKSDELYHFGIKGMHWGIRRYQNYDGTLTPKGRHRYSITTDNIKPTFERTEPKKEKHVSKGNGKKIALGVLAVSGAVSILAAKEVGHYEVHRYMTGRDFGMKYSDMLNYEIKRNSGNPFRQYRL